MHNPMAFNEIPRQPGQDRPFQPPVEIDTLRREEPVTPVRMKDGQIAYFVTKHSAVKEVLGDNKRFSASPATPGFPLDNLIGGNTNLFSRFSIVRVDNPNHARLRRAVQAPFRPREVPKHTAMITEVAQQCLDDVRAAGSPADIVPLYTSEIPSRVICKVMGVPESLRKEAKKLSWTVGVPRPAGQLDGYDELGEFLRDIVRHIDADANSPVVLSFLKAALEAGEMSEDELVAKAVLVLQAGHETTAQTMALGCARILTEPDLYRALAAEPEFSDDAVEEMIRYTATIRGGPRRVALEEVTVDGKTYPAGTGFITSLHAANHDPDVFENPGAFKPGRDMGRAHLSFSFGMHQCLGQFLARLELKIGMQTLFHGLPELRLDRPASELSFHGGAGVYGIDTLPLAWKS
ncbi:MAG: cytochrome P450 [Rhodobacter sp.]|nr:cytochrome P450 [Rhodobacter sp.]